jgi:hypothetical protein
MPTLLEQAIIDAQEIRNAALRNAESTILEKYNNEVKNVVESLIEQEEDDLGLGALEDEEVLDPGMATGEEVGLADEPAFTAAEGEEMCPCPDAGEQQEMTFSFEDLRAMADELEGSEAMGEPEGQEELMGDLGMAPEEEEEELPLELQEEIDVEEDIDLDEDMIKELVEELVVDIRPVKTGHLATPEGVMRHAEELELARLASTEAQEEMTALKDARDRLTITNESLEKLNNKLSKALYVLKERLDEVNLSNAKLLYSNQALSSASLNERQKLKVVDSIQKADSVEEAKVIFETLQSAVGSPKRELKSLSEVIRRPSSTMPRRRNVNSDRESLLKERFQKLAGLK